MLRKLFHRKGCKALEHAAQEVEASSSLQVSQKPVEVALRTWFSGEHVGRAGLTIDLMILKVFSNLNNSAILLDYNGSLVCEQ